jgi:peptide/nickel transport system substrate-binding protein
VSNGPRSRIPRPPRQRCSVAALQRGEVDWLQQPLLDLVPMLGKTAGVKIDAVDPFGNLAILRFNHLLPPFNNAEMRRALLPGIDQMAVVQAVVGDQEQYGRAPVGFFTADGPMANDAGLHVLTGPRSADEARRRIDAAGYMRRRQCVVRTSDHLDMVAPKRIDTAPQCCRVMAQVQTPRRRYARG